MQKFVLCHKCSGTFWGRGHPKLIGCGCISSYQRGFEESLTLNEAIERQLQACADRMLLYIEQDRHPESQNVQSVRDNIKKLLDAKAKGE